MLENAFQNGKAFIPFITLGDPNLAISKEVIFALNAAGADIIELGIPFSDPVAEGAVIASASKRALDNGVNIAKIFELLAQIQGKITAKLAIMTYANVVFSNANFLREAGNLGVKGLILPDVPFEEKGEFDGACKKCGIDLISFIAPTSSEARIAHIARESRGFLYCVSALGVTGMRNNFSANLESMAKIVRENSQTPLAVGFGIHSPSQAREMARFADGVIIGSAIVKICADSGKNAARNVEKFAREVKAAIREV